MLSIFITGGIGSGKSTLMEFLKEKGAGIVLADEVGHENLHDSEMKAELVKAISVTSFNERVKDLFLL